MQKNCKQCNKKFVIPEEDKIYLKKIAFEVDGREFEMPSPTLCFACRHQKRLAFRNEMNLYHRKCDFSGNQIISMYSPDKPHKIYDQHIWWSDKWDPMEYGQDFDFTRPFFEQYRELQLKVPRMSLNNLDPENSDYCNLSYKNKNCYLAFTADENEDSSYIRFADWNYRCLDCDYTYSSTDCYESINLEKCNNCAYSQLCINSSDLFACYNMIGCQDCIGCVNLRNKKYAIFNEVCISREDCMQKKREFGLDTYSGFQKFMDKYKEFLQKQPRRSLEVVNCENSVGDYLLNCKNAQYCYNGFDLEDCKYMINCYKAKNCYDWDFVASTGCVDCHEMSSCASNMVNCHFCAGCWQGCNEIYYCELCLHSKNLFGCVGLRHKKYCILNKQYSKEEYEELVPKIVEHMGGRAHGASAQAPALGGLFSSSEAELKNKEWGEFFPMEFSAYAYNESVAAEYFPLNKQQVEAKGLKWFDDETEKLYKGPKYELPESTKDATDEICKQILKCEVSGRPYKIIPQELNFCKMKGLPLPRISPRERHKKRMALRNGFALYDRKCDKCFKDIRTTYASERVEPVYCEECNKNEIY